MSNKPKPEPEWIEAWTEILVGAYSMYEDRDTAGRLEACAAEVASRVGAPPTADHTDSVSQEHAIAVGEAERRGELEDTIGRCLALLHAPGFDNDGGPADLVAEIESLLSIQRALVEEVGILSDTITTVRRTVKTVTEQIERQGRRQKLFDLQAKDDGLWLVVNGPILDMVCEAHPWLEWPHDDCPGPGMPAKNALTLFAECRARLATAEGRASGLQEFAARQSKEIVTLVGERDALTAERNRSGHADHAGGHH
jgi:hypothetical protein